MNELYVPKNPIETAQELQWEINMAHPEVAPEIAQQAIDVIGDVREIYEGHHILIHTLAAYILPRHRTRTENLTVQFNELVLRGYFGGIYFAQGAFDSHFQTLIVDMFDVRILDPIDQEDPNKGRIADPLSIPVQDIQTVLAA